jgi:hypothetical protein
MNPIYILKSPPRIFLKEFLKKNYDRLGNILELLKWQGRALMPIHHLGTISPRERAVLVRERARRTVRVE